MRAHIPHDNRNNVRSSGAPINASPMMLKLLCIFIIFASPIPVRKAHRRALSLLLCTRKLGREPSVEARFADPLYGRRLAMGFKPGTVSAVKPAPGDDTTHPPYHGGPRSCGSRQHLIVIAKVNPANFQIAVTALALPD